MVDMRPGIAAFDPRLALLLEHARSERLKPLLRLAIAVVASGFLFAFVTATAGWLWIAAVFLIELLAWRIRRRLLRGDFSRAPVYLASVAANGLAWVVLALLLWRTGDELARIAALIDLFSVALYGAIGGHRDRRIMAALLTAPLLTLSVLLVHFAWANAEPWLAMITTLASLGACATILANAIAMHFTSIALAKAHAALSAERDLLEARVTERTRDLAAAMQRAEAANHAKSQFLAAMSHELRTPLNAIIGYTDLIREDLALGAKPHEEDVERIGAASQRLLGMVDDVLDLASIESGDMAVARAPTDAAALARMAVDAAAPIARQHDARISLEVGDGLPTIETDAGKVLRCLDNLLSNACKFGGGYVRVSVALEEDEASPALVIRVWDNGPGIPPDKLSRLLDPFVQAEEGYTRAHDGAGLGLALTRTLAGLIGGRFKLDSAAGRGTTASLHLPVLHADARLQPV